MAATDPVTLWQRSGTGAGGGFGGDV